MSGSERGRFWKGNFSLKDCQPPLSPFLSSAPFFLHLHRQGREEEGLRREIEDRRRTHGQGNREWAEGALTPRWKKWVLKQIPNLLLYLQGLQENFASNVEWERVQPTLFRSRLGVAAIFLLCFPCGLVFWVEATGCRDRWEAERAKLIAVLRLLAGGLASGFCFIRIHNLDCFPIDTKLYPVGLPKSFGNPVQSKQFSQTPPSRDGVADVNSQIWLEQCQ